MNRMNGELFSCTGLFNEAKFLRRCFHDVLLARDLSKSKQYAKWLKLYRNYRNLSPLSFGLVMWWDR